MKFIPRLIGLVLLFSFSACKIQEAKAPKKQNLIIASDFLKWNDTLLFRSFEKRFHCNVIIHTMKDDSLLKTLKKNRIENTIDIVLFNSFESIQPFAKAKLTQRLPEEQWKINRYFHDFGNQYYHSFGFGIDPYVFVFEHDSVNKTNSFKDLTYKYAWSWDEDESDELHSLIAELSHQIGGANKSKQKTKWFRRFFKQASDSTVAANSLEIAKFSSLDLKASKPFVFPNQATKGAYFDLRSGFVVTQARHYELACQFINYLYEDKVNLRVNRKIQSISLASIQNKAFDWQGSKVKLYQYGPNKLIKERKFSHWILKKNNKR
jgi:spermidine/putrescine-binding protein